MENAYKNEVGYKGNRYEEEIKEIASYCYIRGGKFFYNFLSINLSLPELSTVRRFMSDEMNLLYEGEMQFDFICDFMRSNNIKMQVGIFEDGTKINEKIDYDVQNNSLIGLVAPFNTNTGLPDVHHFKARNALEIFNHIKNSPRASYLQVIMAQPNDVRSPSFVLGYYGTDNKMTQSDVFTRGNYISSEFQKRGVKVICHGSDGDTRFLCAQKKFVEFGSPSTFGSLTLAGNLNSTEKGMQDGYHDAKKMSDRMYDLGLNLIMGERVATVNHLILIYKKYSKNEHRLVLSDIDSTDHMNYR